MMSARLVSVAAKSPGPQTTPMNVNLLNTQVTTLETEAATIKFFVPPPGSSSGSDSEDESLPSHCTNPAESHTHRQCDDSERIDNCDHGDSVLLQPENKCNSSPSIIDSLSDREMVEGIRDDSVPVVTENTCTVVPVIDRPSISDDTVPEVSDREYAVNNRIAEINTQNASTVNNQIVLTKDVCDSGELDANQVSSINKQANANIEDSVMQKIADVHEQTLNNDCNSAHRQWDERANEYNDSSYERRVAEMRSKRFNPFDYDVHVTEDHFSESPEHSIHPVADDFPKQQRVNRLSTSSMDSWSDGPLMVGFTGNDIITNAELGLTEDHFSQPEGYFGLSTTEELEMAIANCKRMIVECTENSDRKRNLVHKLVQLRMKLADAKEGPVQEDPSIKSVLGHRLIQRNSSKSKHYCEKCNAVIWGVLQIWYKCADCGYSCHAKCLSSVTRTCASVKVAENPSYILSVCPEKGLAAQKYRCAECKTNISNKSGSREPRICDYNGSYYCDQCHWNDLVVIPARILHNWDFEPRKVCRASKQFLKLMYGRSVVRIQDINPMLFSFVEELNEVKKLREEILIMKKYFLSCKAALDSKLLLQLTDRQHFVENSDMYSIKDLLGTRTDELLPLLAKIHSSFAQHIKTDCKLCQAKGFMCELCDVHEVLFPFDNIAIVCAQCSTVLHRHCFVRRQNKCPKCERRNQREALQRSLSGPIRDMVHPNVKEAVS